jgi:predicted DNA-binding protein
MRHQISARLSDETYAQLKALSAVLQASQAEVIARGFEALEQSLSDSEQQLLALLKKRETT